MDNLLSHLKSALPCGQVCHGLLQAASQWPQGYAGTATLTGECGLPVGAACTLSACSGPAQRHLFCFTVDAAMPGQPSILVGPMGPSLRQTGLSLTSFSWGILPPSESCERASTHFQGTNSLPRMTRVSRIMIFSLGLLQALHISSLATILLDPSWPEKQVACPVACWPQSLACIRRHESVWNRPGRTPVSPLTLNSKLITHR